MHLVSSSPTRSAGGSCRSTSRRSRSAGAARPTCAWPAPTSRACTPKSCSRTASVCSTTGSRASARSSTTSGSTARRSSHGDRIRLGQSSDVEIVFAIGEDAPSAERSAASAAIELRQMAALLEGLRALGSGRVLDEVLALVLDSAIEVTGAERGFIMLANRDGAARVHAGARAREGHAVGPHVRDQPQDSRTGLRHRQARDRRGSAGRRPGAAAQRHGRARHPPRAVHAAPARALRRARRRQARGRDDRRPVSRQPRARRPAARRASRSALETLSAEAALAIENARLYREALDKAKFEQELKVAAAIQRALLPAASVDRGVLHGARLVGRRAWPSAATSSTTSICPTASSASSSATSPARDRRPRCWRRPCSACSAPNARIRCSPAARHLAAQPRPVPPRDREPVPDGVLRHPRLRTARSRITNAGPQRAGARVGVTACGVSRPAAWCSACSSTRRSKRRRCTLSPAISSSRSATA